MSEEPNPPAFPPDEDVRLLKRRPLRRPPPESTFSYPESAVLRELCARAREVVDEFSSLQGGHLPVSAVDLLGLVTQVEGERGWYNREEDWRRDG